jgi:hypothetical protein
MRFIKEFSQSLSVLKIVAAAVLTLTLTAVPAIAGSLANPEDVIVRYGKPDQVKSSEYEKPRPPFVTKQFIYKKERVRFLFLADAPIGSPPPYAKWKMLGAQNPRDNSVLKGDEAFIRMAKRDKQKGK